MPRMARQAVWWCGAALVTCGAAGAAPRDATTTQRLANAAAHMPADFAYRAGVDQAVTKPGDSDTLANEPWVAAYVVFAADTPADIGREIIWTHGARVRSRIHSLNAFVIELPLHAVAELAADAHVRWIEPALPPLAGMNDSNRAAVGVNVVQAAPYGLDGSGVTVLVYDSGAVATTHADLTGRVFVRDGGTTRTHATSVAGTIGGSGAASSGQYRGMAPACVMQSYTFQVSGVPGAGVLYTDPGDLEADYTAAINTYGAVLANNSIGANIESNYFDCAWQGDYGVTAALIDAIVRGSLGQPICIVWSAGNERAGDRCDVEGFGDYYSITPPAGTKNALVVGAVNSDNFASTATSSWGPTDDGRIKPDLVAPGCEVSGDLGVTSCDKNGSYSTSCTTSLACATVTGVAALLFEDWRTQYPDAGDPNNALIKALLVHSAADEVTVDDPPGPDYVYGYGVVQADAAVGLLRGASFTTDTLTEGASYTQYVFVGATAAELRVTLVWDDPPAAPGAATTLVNDLDLRVYGAANAEYFPWTLDPQAPSVPAVQTQGDHTNNIEQVCIAAPTPGVYRVEVQGYAVPQGPQNFALCVTPAQATCASAGTITLGRPEVSCETTLFIEVADCDLNADPATEETATVTVTSDSEPAGEIVTLNETGADSGVFQGTLTLSGLDAAGVLQVMSDDVVHATYIDADDGAGGIDVTQTAEATVDCTTPTITSVQIVADAADTAEVTIVADEPTQIVIDYGTDCAALTETVYEATFATTHTLVLPQLAAETTYFLAVTARDAAGNIATADNDGSCYSFTTTIAATDQAQDIVADFDLDGYRLEFTPDDSPAYYSVCADLINALPYDPNDGTTLTLTEDTFATVDPNTPVQLYGVSYDKFYVGSNGYLTFATGDSTFQPSLLAHFSQPRVSALFCDLSPQYGVVSWRVIESSVIVTWRNVRTYNTTKTNTFQVALHADGRVEIAWVGINADAAVVGLSAGAGIPVDFVESDFSVATPCGEWPPTAEDLDITLHDYLPATIALPATDDGLPDPPAALTYQILSLPTYELLDAGTSHRITADELPYTLADGGDSVIYRRFSPWATSDQFTYHADDGGTAPTGGTSRIATVRIALGERTRVYEFPFDSDPNWTATGDWAFGTPLGSGSYMRDPTSGYTGSYVYGYNLAGDYTNNMTAQTLTSTAMDCSAYRRVQLRFRRWLGIEAATFDQAQVQVSTNGTTWTNVWQHSGTAIQEASWSLQTLDLSSFADEQAAVQVRWVIGPTDGTGTAPGWNIDDVEIWALNQPNPVGDLNCDGTLNFFDIDPFVVALTHREAYYVLFPDCNYWYADANRDGAVDFFDIDAFVNALASSGG